MGKERIERYKSLPGLAIFNSEARVKMIESKKIIGINYINRTLDHQRTTEIAAEIIKKIPLNTVISIKEKDPNSPGKDIKIRTEILDKDDYSVTFQKGQSPELLKLEHRSFCQLTNLLTRNKQGVLVENKLLVDLLCESDSI